MYRVRIDRFEGPFDLLVYLLESAKMDIYDIRVSKITEQYLEYLKQMEDLDIEISSEFIVLAAVLIRLKSHMLLPRINEDGEVVFEEDPRTDLANKIAEYVKTKQIAEMLAAREEKYMNVFEKPAEDMSKYLDEPDELLVAKEDQLVSAFILFLTKKKKVEDVTKRYQRVRRQKESIEVRIKQMTQEIERRLAMNGKVTFNELLPAEHDRYDIAASFFSLLSMLKEQDIDADQREAFGEITIMRKEESNV